MQKISNQDIGHSKDVEVKTNGMEASLLRSLHTDKGPNGGNYDARRRRLKCREVCLNGEKAETLHFNAGYETVDMFIHTILSVNHLRFYRAQLHYGTSRNGRRYSFPNTGLYMSQGTKPRILWSHALRDQSHSIKEVTSIEFKSRGLVSRDAGFSKSVELDGSLWFDQQLYLKETELPRLGVTFPMCVMTRKPKQKVYWEIIPFF